MLLATLLTQLPDVSVRGKTLVTIIDDDGEQQDACPYIFLVFFHKDNVKLCMSTEGKVYLFI